MYCRRRADTFSAKRGRRPAYVPGPANGHLPPPWLLLAANMLHQMHRFRFWDFAKSAGKVVVDVGTTVVKSVVDFVGNVLSRFKLW